MGREPRRPAYGLLLLALAAMAGTALSIYAYFESEAIGHTAGVLLVMGTIAIMALAAMIPTALPSLPRWLRAIILLLLLIDILGSGIAAWFLESQVLIALMGLALLGWVIHLVAGPSRAPRSRGESAAARTAA
jgi:hypothetical protein